ncbi:MAG: DNA polymerase III subunit alpha, partial [Rikenellaceae bacterium]|nr:DNA polymerase III subunit alpha [Rikenellaceae bacterium]
DIDFDEDGRDLVLKYVTEKYGRKRVAQIITFGSMAPKMAIRDVGRIQKLSLQESDRLAKLVPEKPGVSFSKAYKEVPELAKERESNNPVIRDTLKYAEKLEGSIRQTGVHACGVIIGQDDLEMFAPIAVAKDKNAEQPKDKKNKEEQYVNVVQFEGKLVEDVGLIKMDFLGLKNLSIIKDAVENIKQTRGENIDIEAIPLDDAPTYELYARGDTTGLFQFESPGMKKHLRNLKPTRFEDLIAMNALYRPGPMEYIPSFCERKHGREKITYDLPEMEEYLSDTYGITVYQEQVMLLSQKLGGFTGGQADTLRKAMGKKIRSTLDSLKPQFLEGAAQKGHDPKICEKIWGDWEAFAEYAFNKSHSTCYAYVSYQTAYLKAHYPSEYMAALLSRNLSDIKKISFFMDESKRMGIQVLGPDVNESYLRFAADEKGDIRFGLAAIKGVGEAAVESIIAERRENGHFNSICDFFERINLQAVNKKTIENLALSGAFDALAGFPRSRFFVADLSSRDGDVNFLEQLIRYGSRIQNERNNSQQSLFGGAADADIQKPQPPEGAEWTQLEMLNKEREVIGIYLSSHPLDEYSIIIRNFTNTQLTDLENLEPLQGRDFSVAGMVTAVQNLMTKSGKPFGRFTVEDYSGSYTFTLFDKDYENFRRFMFADYFLLIRGKVQLKPYRESKELETKLTQMMQLNEARETLVKEMSISLNVNDLTEEFIDDLAEVVTETKGNILLRARVADPESEVSVGLSSRQRRVALGPPLIDFLETNEVRYTLM